MPATQVTPSLPLSTAATSLFTAQHWAFLPLHDAAVMVHQAGSGGRGQRGLLQGLRQLDMVIFRGT